MCSETLRARKVVSERLAPWIKNLMRTTACRLRGTRHFALCTLHFAFCISLLTALLPNQSLAKEKVVFWYGATQDERVAYEEMIADFNRTHPDIEVRGMLVPQSLVERKLLLSVAGKVPPDVVRFYTHLGGEMMSRGALEPLNDMIEREKFDMSDFYPVGIEQNTYKGKLYGVPWVMSPYALFYNKKLFREAGLDPNKPPTNWKELEDYALKLTVRKKDGSIERIGYANFLNNPTDFHLYLWQSGGSPLSDDLTRTAFQSPEGVEALTWMRDFLIRQAGPMEPGVSPEKATEEALRNVQKFNSSYVGATQDPFGLGKVAMRIDTPFRIPDLNKYFPDLDFGIAPIPYNKVRAMEVVGNALVIPRGSKHRDAAWEFIKFASSREQMLRICRVAGRIPARRSAATDPSIYANPLARPFVDQIEYGRTTPIAPGYRQVGSELARAIEMTLTEQATPKAALETAARSGQVILDEANEDPDRYPEVPWATLGIVAFVLVTAVTGGVWWYVLRQTRGSKVARRNAVAFYLFLSPWLVGFFVLTVGATLASFLLSFARWDAVNPARFTGLMNFSEIVNDPLFIKALINTLYYAAFSIPLAMVGGLAISLLVNQKLRGMAFFRTIYYLPAIVAGVATVMLWQSLFNPNTGLLNKVLIALGIDKLILMLFNVNIQNGFLIDPVLVKPAFIIMALWGVGGAMIIYLAGLQGIPEELYEASRIDGASTWQRFLNVTLPLLTPTIFYQLIIGTMAAFQFFTQVYIMFGGTGGPQDSAMFYSLYLFKNAFEWMRMGYASAMAWLLFALVLVITIIQFKISGRWVYYEGKSEE